MFLAAAQACASTVPPDSTWPPLQGWRLSGSETCPISRRAILSCLLLRFAAGFTTFPLKCSALRSPASFLPPGGTVIKLLQRNTHEEHDLRPGHLRRSPVAVGLGCVGPGWRSEPLRLTVSRPGEGGPSSDLASQLPPPLLRTQPRLSTRRAPTGPHAITSLPVLPAPVAHEAPRHEVPLSLIPGKAVPRQYVSARTGQPVHRERPAVSNQAAAKGTGSSPLALPRWNLCPEGRGTGPALLTRAELRSQRPGLGGGTAGGCGSNTTLSFSFHQNLGEFHKQMFLRLSTYVLLLMYYFISVYLLLFLGKFPDPVNSR